MAMNNKIDDWKSAIERCEKSIRRYKVAILGHEKEARKHRKFIESDLRLMGHFRTQLKLEKQRQWRRALRTWGREPLR
jgi:hypothetical protein